MSIEDPFSALVANELKESPIPALSINNVSSGEAAGSQVRATFKSGLGFDVPWVTVDYPSIEAAHGDLTNTDRQKQLVEVFDIVARANVAFAEKYAAHKPETAAPQGSGQAAPAQQAGATPQAARGAPGGQTRSCNHGQMTFRSGVGNGGKAWSAFFCPTPKGDPNQCDPEWIR